MSIHSHTAVTKESRYNHRILLGWYDRELAAAVFETDRALMEQTDDQELATWGIGF